MNYEVIKKYPNSYDQGIAFKKAMNEFIEYLTNVKKMTEEKESYKFNYNKRFHLQDMIQFAVDCKGMSEDEIVEYSQKFNI